MNATAAATHAAPPRTATEAQNGFVAEAALHGYAPPWPELAAEPPLTVVVSREAGARGASAARRAADLLGWQFFRQEALEFLAQDDALASADAPPADQEAWIDRRMADLRANGWLLPRAEVEAVARAVLAAAAQGECVLLGRGPALILPADCRLAVHLVAPESDRIAYLAQSERLTAAEAAQEVRERDAQRLAMAQQWFGPAVADPAQFDLVLNTSQLGVEGCARVIVAAAQEKAAHLLEQRRGWTGLD